MKALKFSLYVSLSLLAPLFVKATLVGPYTPDAHTLFLVHFDESAGGSLATNVGSFGGNFITTTNTTSGNGLANPPVVSTLLGYTSYSGFGNAVSGTNIVAPNTNGLVGFDGNHNGVYDADVQGGQSSPDAISMTNLNIGVGAGNSPFTIEAVIKVPSINTVNHQEIVCSDSYHSRGFQFRITKTGQLEFNMIAMGSGNDFLAPIPTSGPQAFVPNAWYHVALVYDGSDLTFYWTALNPTNTAAHTILTVPWTSTTAAAVTAPLVIGNENRGSSQEVFEGLIDEVRISDVARGPGNMQFTSPGVTLVEQPVSQNIDNFMPVTFSALGASADTNLFYQWRFNSMPIPNATNTSYSIHSVQDTDEGFYDVVVSNSFGSSATSTNATLVVGAVNFLAHRWSFTNDLTDSIGGANGTSNGTLSVSGGALVFDGSSNCFMSLPPHMLKDTLAVTFDFWATFNTNGNYSRVFDFGNTNFSGGAGIRPPENYVFFTPSGGGNQVLGIAPGNEQSQLSLTASGTLDNQTVHVTCVVDPPEGFMWIYTNGVVEATYTNLNVPISSLDDQLCWIGRSLFTVDGWLNASIDELRIFNGALSPETILQENATGPDVLPYIGPVKLAHQPVDKLTVNGQPVTFTSAAIGHQAITYQWYENGSAIPEATNASYTFTAVTAQDGHTFHVAATNSILGTNYSAVSTNATLTIWVPRALTWLGVNGSNWNTTTVNWTTGSSQVAYHQYDNPTFDDTGIGQSAVDVTQALSMVGLTVNNSSGNYVIGSSTHNGSLDGLATLVKSGAGQLTLDLADNLSGGTYIQDGTLQFGNGGGSGSLGAGDVTNNASLVFNRTNTVAVTNAIHGTGTITLNGTGTVSVSGSNDYSGATLVNAGTLELRNASGLGGTSAGTTVGNGGQVYITLNFDVSEPLTITGGGPGGTSGALRKGGAGLTTEYAPVTLTGDTTLRVDGNATLNLTNSTGLDAPSGANLTLTGDGGGQGIIVGPLSLGSSATLTVNGAAWTVAANNTYSGLTTINGGALRITGAGSLGPVPGAFNASQITLAGGALEAVNDFNLNDGNRGITVSSSSTITVDTNATFSIANDIAGGGSVTLTKTGPGTLVLSGANYNYLGYLNLDTNSTSANDGMTVVANNAAITNMLAIPGIPSIFIRNNNAGSSTLGLDGTSGSINVAQDISLAGRNNSVPAIENLVGDNTISGNFSLVTGGSYILQSDSGTLTLTQPWPYAPPPGTTTARTLILQGAGDITMGVVQDGTFGSTNVPVTLIKDGSGTVNLSVANTYSGATTVNGGVLAVTGGISSTGGVFVAGGALAGAGTIGDNVTISNSIASGTIDTLAVNGNFTISGPLAVDVNRSGLQSDKPTVSGVISNSGAGSIVVNNLGAPLQVGDQFVLFNKAVSNGASMTVTGGGAQWNNNLAADGSISVASTVASNPTNIVAELTGNQLTLTWPQDHTGWVLQAQTNTTATGLSTNWFDVAGSAATNQVSFMVDPTNGCVFYRLVSPY